MSTFLRIKKGIKNFLYDPEYKIGIFAVKHFRPDLIPDRIFLKYQFHYVFGYKLDLKHPKTFNEKLQWLKLYDRNPLYTTLVDKLTVKNWVADTIGRQYVIPTLAVYDTVDEIDLDRLPDQFVLKCTHDSGSVVICRDKNSFDINTSKQKLESGLHNSFYLKHREWPYKNIKRRILAEQYLVDENGELRDYKFFSFAGKVEYVMVCIDRSKNDTKYYFFNKDWELERLNIRGKNAASDFLLPKPKNLEKMYEIAERLSVGIPFVRVDLYNVLGHIYFGEMTFFPDSGLDKNLLPEADRLFGDMIVIKEKNRV